MEEYFLYKKSFTWLNIIVDVLVCLLLVMLYLSVACKNEIKNVYHDNDHENISILKKLRS